MEGKTFSYVNLVTLIIELNFTLKSKHQRSITRITYVKTLIYILPIFP